VLRRPGRQDGYSLIELLVAITVFALVFAAVTIGIGRALELGRGNRNRSAGAYLATRQLEEVRSTPFDSVALGRTTCAYTSPSPCSVPAPYTITQDVVWTGPGNTTASCNVPTSGALAYKRVTVTVTWPDMGGVAPVRSQTLLTPPSGSYDPNEGHILVEVFDRNAGPAGGLTVALTGPETATQPTTAEGCAFFAYLEPGDYDVTLNTSGRVDGQGGQPAVQTVAVLAGQVSNLQFDYDRAATLRVGLTAPANAQIPTGIPLTVANTRLTVGTLSYPESAATGFGVTRTITPLFPYLDGYQVWTGSCADADPSAHTGGSRSTALASNPGATTNGTAVLDAVDVTVRWLSTGGALVPGAAVGASHAAGTGCTSGQALTTTARTGSNGQLRLALPYGTWTIQGSITVAPFGTRTGTATVTVDPVSTAVPAVTVVLR
jgi:prepilin-type N-terminal cleavage/methylation domain-containing protein